MEELTDLHKLSKRTKLVWDARHVGNYAKNAYYPALVVSEKNENPKLGALIKFPNNQHWIKSPDNFLRFPTNNELEVLKWPDL